MVQLNINVGNVPSTDDDGFCDSTRHRPECLKDISESHKLSFRLL